MNIQVRAELEETKAVEKPSLPETTLELYDDKLIGADGYPHAVAKYSSQ